MKNLLLLFFLTFTFLLKAQNQSSVNLYISVNEGIRENWSEKGRLVVFFSKNGEREPVFQSSFSSERIGFARNITQWNSYNKVNLNSLNSFGTGDFSLHSIPNGKWFVQAVYNISNNPDFRTDRNLYSEVIELEIKEEQIVGLELSKIVQSRRNNEPIESKLVKFIKLDSKLLTAFWGKPMTIKASVLLPKNFQSHSEKKYPVRINIGGYGSSWTRASRVERDSVFMNWWLSDNSPEIITIFPDGDGPFGDPYYIDSENSGPYGSALTQELIPYIENEFHGIGKPEYRFVDGCSTGGWVSFALQVFYPDYFNGAWSFSADPVDFDYMQLVNLYEEENVFYNEFGYLTPSIRTKTGQPRLSIKAEVAGENLSSFENSYTTSHGQWGGWNALYSPKGENGLPMAAFDPVSGEINKEVIKYWEKYDLLKIVQKNWPELGSKLQGKIWAWMGDMDQFYLNNAMREMDAFLKSTTNPKSDAQIIFEPMKGHCEEFDHRWVLEMIQEKVKMMEK